MSVTKQLNQYCTRLETHARISGFCSNRSLDIHAFKQPHKRAVPSPLKLTQYSACACPIKTGEREREREGGGREREKRGKGDIDYTKKLVLDPELD